MSRETMTWLNQNTLIGFTEKRGHAWHYDQDLQEGAGNHYEGAIPVADVEKRLFDWDAIELPVTATVEVPGMNESGEFETVTTHVEIPGKKAIANSKTLDVYGIFSQSYVAHQFREWLIKNVSTILGDTLSIGSAGLLQKGAVAWVSVEVPDSIETPEGIVFRPNLLACTSHNGSLATTYKRVVTNVVCDNTMAAGLAEDGQVFKVRHTSRSMNRIHEARDALAIMETAAADFEAEVKALCETTVTDKQWANFLELHAPKLEKDGTEKTGRAFTLAVKEQEQLSQLWKADPRVEPWKNTAFGVLQAVNTHTHHFQTVRNTDRRERNMLRALRGGVDDLDTSTIKELELVLANS